MTSDFNRNAREYAATVSQRVILIDGKQLAGLMIEHSIDASLFQSYQVKRIDSDYFEEG